MTTKQNIAKELIDAGMFTKKDIGTPCMDFWIKNIIEERDDADIDRYAWLNTLFGYDIGFDNAMQIDNWLWDNENGDEIETLELHATDKLLIEQCVKELKLNIVFDKWVTEEPECFVYYR